MEVTIRPKSKADAVVANAVIANPPIAPSAILVCEACGWRPHKFIITRRASIGSASLEQIYACTHCHKERRYGLLSHNNY